MRRRILENKIQYESVTATSNIATTITINGSSKSNTKSYTVQVPYGTTYTVSASNITNYSKTGGGTYTASLPTRSVSITYSILLEKVTVTTNVACTIYIGSNTSSSGVTSYTAYIPYGTSYTVSVSSVSGYDKPSNQTFTASNATRSVTMNYTEHIVYTGIYFNNTTSSGINVTINLIANNGWPDSQSVTVPSNTSNYFYNLSSYIGSHRISEIYSSYGLTITSGEGRNYGYNDILIDSDYLYFNEGDTFYITIYN